VLLLSLLQKLEQVLNFVSFSAFRLRVIHILVDGVALDLSLEEGNAQALGYLGSQLDSNGLVHERVLLALLGRMEGSDCQELVAVADGLEGVEEAVLASTDQ